MTVRAVFAAAVLVLAGLCSVAGLADVPERTPEGTSAGALSGHARMLVGAWSCQMPPVPMLFPEPPVTRLEVSADGTGHEYFLWSSYPEDDLGSMAMAFMASFDWVVVADELVQTMTRLEIVGIGADAGFGDWPMDVFAMADSLVADPGLAEEIGAEYRTRLRFASPDRLVLADADENLTRCSRILR